MSRPSPAAALAFLTAVNLLNYADRQAVYALLPAISRDLSLSDAQAGGLASAFMAVYMLAAPPIAWLAESGRRARWVAGGIALWSAATASAAAAPGFSSLFAGRALVGIGEACYGAVAPALVSERFEPARRGMALAVFSMAIPVGSAIGYAGGGAAGQAWGWRTALCLAGLPGLLLALLAPRFIPDSPAAAAEAPWKGYGEVWSIPTFRLVSLAGAAMSFALGGFAVWMPTFLHRAWGLDLARAGTLFGAITVAAGLAGSLLGGWLADRLQTRVRQAYLFVSGAGLLAGMPLAAAAVLAPNAAAAAATFFVAETLLFLNMGPLNAAIAAVVAPSRRALAYAANIFVIHALGDAASPALIGWASDAAGLRLALLGTCLALGLGGALCLAARTRYDEDMRAAEAAA